MLGGSVSVAVLQLLHVPAADTGELWVLLVVRVLTGAASSAMYLSQATVATELPNPEHRDRALRSSPPRFSSGSRWAGGRRDGDAGPRLRLGLRGLGRLRRFEHDRQPRPARDPACRCRAGGVRERPVPPGGVRIGIVNLLVFVGFMGFNAFIADYAEEFDIDDARWLL